MICIRRYVSPALLIVLLVLLGSLAVAQTPAGNSNTSAQDKSKKGKAPRVWTNEEVQKIRGGINVVGEPAKSPTEKNAGSDTAEGDQTSPASPRRKPEVCQSDLWAAGVEAMVGAQGVGFNRDYWAMKLFGGKCLEDVDAVTVASGLTGDYTLDDGSRVRLNAVPGGGIPRGAVVVDGLNTNRPWILVWKKQPLVVIHADYSDTAYCDSGGCVHDYTIKSLTLANALSGERAILNLLKTPASEVGGALQVTVSARQ